MAEPLKNIYNESFLQEFCKTMQEVYPTFDTNAFTESALNKDWPKLELKERMRHLSTCLRDRLPEPLDEAYGIICKFTSLLQGDDEEAMSFPCMFLPDFVQQYGLADFDLSIQAMETITQFSSCEFAVRPFLVQYREQMLDRMLGWSKHQHAMVRRLATEGSRPRLPWGLGVPYLKKEPELTLSILEKLKTDPSETVRRSVANHLNDISKDHPEFVMDVVERWSGISAETDRLIRHACRGLLKQSHPRALALYGLGGAEHISVQNFQISTPIVKVGEALKFNFDLEHAAKQAMLIRLEYGLYYQKANGSLSKKVFKISEKEYPVGTSVQVKRKQSFRPITTRKYHPGLHRISIIANGREFETHDFTLKMD